MENKMTIKPSTKVQEIVEFFSNHYPDESPIGILTLKGNWAGNDRRLRALTEKDLSKGIIIELKGDIEESIRNLQKKLGVSTYRNMSKVDIDSILNLSTSDNSDFSEELNRLSGENVYVEFETYNENSDDTFVTERIIVNYLDSEFIINKTQTNFQRAKWNMILSSETVSEFLSNYIEGEIELPDGEDLALSEVLGSESEYNYELISAEIGSEIIPENILNGEKLNVWELMNFAEKVSVDEIDFSWGIINSAKFTIVKTGNTYEIN